MRTIQGVMRNLLVDLVLRAKVLEDMQELDTLIETALGRLARASRESEALLDETSLADRYPCLFTNKRSLQNHRSRKTGPPYIKIGGRVMYRVRDVEAWITEHERLTYMTL